MRSANASENSAAATTPSKARQDAKEFGIARSLSDYLMQFDPPNRKRRILAMLAELENWLIGCEILENISRDLKRHVGRSRKRSPAHKWKSG